MGLHIAHISIKPPKTPYIPHIASTAPHIAHISIKPPKTPYIPHMGLHRPPHSPYFPKTS